VDKEGTLEGLTGAQYAELLGGEWYDDDPDCCGDDLPEGEDVCPNCGGYGRLTDDEETYICPGCGEQWDRWPWPRRSEIGGRNGKGL
jgi:hypothetical protein